MAKDKKSFLLYCDLIYTVSKMPNDKAGELFKHILSYVNDENPINNDLIIQLTFEPIKQSLKRDLQKYENIRAKNIENANKRWNKNNATASECIPNDAKNAVSDSVNVSVNDSVREKKKRVVNKFTPPSLQEVIDYFAENKFSKELAEKAFKYYETGEWKDGKGNQVRNWKQKMQSVWFKEENKTTAKPQYISPA